MNKKLMSVAIVGVLLLIGLVGSVVAFAQSELPAVAQEDSVAEWVQNGPGGAANQGNRGGGPGMGSGPRVGDAPGLGFVDENEMHVAIAAALGIPVAELEAAQAAGTPLAILAQDVGADLTVVREAMATVREAAIDEAVANGTLTGEQAEWLLSRPAFGQRAGGAGAGNNYQGTGPGMGRGGNGMGQHRRMPTELTGRGSANGQGFGPPNTP